MDEVLVSIIIPAYNAELRIEESVNSCLNQSYKNIEVIVVNDGSTDNTLSVVQQINDSRLKVFSQMNMGACVARNRGFDESHGEYVKFFDADDYMYPDAIEKQLDEALKHDHTVITYGGFRRKGEHQTLPKFIAGTKVDIEEVLYGFMTPLPLYHRSVIETIHGFDPVMKFIQDTEIIYSCVENDCLFQYVDVEIYDWMQGVCAKSISCSKDFDFVTVYHLYSKHKEIITENRGIKRKFFVTLLDRFLMSRDGYKSRHFLIWVLLSCPSSVWGSRGYKGSRLFSSLLIVLSLLNGRAALAIVSHIYDIIKG